MRPSLKSAAVTAALAAGAVAAVSAHAAGTATPSHSGRQAAAISHVLVLSVDGLHQSDLMWYVQHHPSSELAQLTAAGREYTNAQTPVPSDSYPGDLALLAGGNPRSAGAYYDDEYNHDLLPAGTKDCAHATPGAAVIYDSPDDINPNALDAGQGLSGLPGSILQLTGDPQRLLRPSTLPVDPRTCKPVYPHQYIQVNTVFDVLHSRGLRTAWSDKHPAYEDLNGPSGNGVDDLFTPEIDSVALMPDGTPYPGGVSWTGDNAATMQYDSYKVQAVLNWIDGFNHSRTKQVGTPAIFGMNFQTVSTAEKLPTSDGLTGGYLPGGNTPGPLLRRALDYINTEVGAMVGELRSQKLLSSTAIIISAKHGQSPQDPRLLTRIDDGPIVAGIDSAWAATHPGAPALVATANDDDAIQIWLSNRSQAAADFVKHYLLTHTATGNTITGATRTLQASGLTTVYAGSAAARYFGVPIRDPRHPDVWGVVQVGVVYTGGRGKIAEHGGANPNDRDVPILVYAPGAAAAGVDDTPVETTQVAPTILHLLGLSATALDAVREEHTPVLPGA
jgi:hypothetical protein